MPRHCGPVAGQRARHGVDPPCRDRSRFGRCRDTQNAARPRRRLCLPGPDDDAQSRAAGRPADRRGAGRPGACRGGQRAVARRASLARGRDRGPRNARRAISAPVLRGHAPARRHRHGDVGATEADHRRRADDGPRRHGAGASAGTAGQAPGGDGRGGHSGDARSRRRGRSRAARRGHVRRAHRRDGKRARYFRAAAPSLYGGLAEERAATGSARQPARSNSRPAADTVGIAGGLLVPSALRSGSRAIPLRVGRSRRADHRERAHRRLPLRRRASRAVAGLCGGARRGSAGCGRTHAASRHRKPAGAFPDPQQGPAPNDRRRACRRRREPDPFAPARRSAWSANPAAARRRSAAP